MRIIDTKNRIIPALFASIAVLLIAGCGGDSDQSTTSEAKAQFIATADHICAQSGAETDAAVQKRVDSLGNKEITSKQLTALFTEVTIPSIENLYKQISELTPPPEDADNVKAILAAADQAIKKSKADPDLLASPEGGATPFDEVNQLEQEFGFKVCGASDPRSS
jgi:hypothetical protein